MGVFKKLLRLNFQCFTLEDFARKKCKFSVHFKSCLNMMKSYDELQERNSTKNVHFIVYNSTEALDSTLKNVNQWS